MYGRIHVQAGLQGSRTWRLVKVFRSQDVSKSSQFVRITDEKVMADIRNITGDNLYTPTEPTELCSRLLVTCYMGTEHSSEETKTRAKNLADEIGSYENDKTFAHQNLK